MKEFWKSVSIWWSYGQDCSSYAFVVHGVHLGKRQGVIGEASCSVHMCVVSSWSELSLAVACGRTPISLREICQKRETVFIGLCSWETPRACISIHYEASNTKLNWPVYESTAPYLLKSSEQLSTEQLKIHNQKSLSVNRLTSELWRMNFRVFEGVAAFLKFQIHTAVHTATRQ